ncbi:MAG: hypothetical protein RIR01_2283 [Bacteroidota bacterium]|jgi:hypothetical protein
MLLEKKIKILDYLKSNDLELKKLGTTILENHQSPQINVWFYLKLPKELREPIFKDLDSSLKFHYYVKKHYEEMDNDSKQEYWNWIIVTHARAIMPEKDKIDLKEIHAFFK